MSMCECVFVCVCDLVNVCVLLPSSLDYVSECVLVRVGESTARLTCECVCAWLCACVSV